MQIIQAGTKKPPVYRGACQACGAVFEESPDKLSVNHLDQRDGPFAEVFCPQCGKPAVMFPRR